MAFLYPLFKYTGRVRSRMEDTMKAIVGPIIPSVPLPTEPTESKLDEEKT